MSTYKLLKDRKFTPSSVIVAEYIWIDANYNLRSKSRTLPFMCNADHKESYLVPSNVPHWNYDGSSTNQAKTENSDVMLHPASVFVDPFRGYPHILVLCSTYTSDGEPLKTNHRHWASEIFDITIETHQPWYGMEQEFFFLDTQDKPIGFPNDGKPEGQGEYYCGVGAKNIFGREIMDVFYQHCILASIKISGINAEVANSQWEFQIGPCCGLEVGDHLWTARYILNRVAEKYGVTVEYHPKPLGREWNGSGLHTNFSTQTMREDGGLQEIKIALEKLKNRHKTHMENYGEENILRMIGIHETSDYYKFTWGVRDRSASARIPPEVAQAGKGYLEDRRPASNADPYLVAGMIYETIVHDEDES